MWPEELTRSLSSSRVIAVLTIDEAERAVPVARALVRGGVTHMELALRTPASLDALREIVREVPEMIPGVGTVIRPEQVEQVKAIGAAFAVSPGFNPRIVDAAAEVDLPFAPGIATPSELEAAWEKGCMVQKLFPAMPLGGPEYLSAMNTPYRYLGIRFIPLGGVSPENVVDWLRLPEIVAVGGSWLAGRDLIRRGEWDEIELRARKLTEQIAAV